MTDLPARETQRSIAEPFSKPELVSDDGDVRRSSEFSSATVAVAVLDALPEIVHVFDAEWRWVHFNRTAAEWFLSVGMDPSSLLGRRAWDFFPSSEGYEAATTAVNEGREVIYSSRREEIEYETRIIPYAGGAVSFTRDVTARLREERRRLFVAETGAAIAGELPLVAMLQRLVGMTAETIADYAVAYIVRGRQLERVAVAHAHAEALPLLHALQSMPPLEIDDKAVGPIFQGGEAILTSPVDHERFAKSPEHSELLRRIATLSAITAPLIVNGAPAGLLSIATCEGGRPSLVPADVHAVVEVARRVGLAIAVEQARHSAQVATARLEGVNAELKLAIDELRSRTTEAEEAREAAESANRAKSTFLGVMSHELRTPLNAILGFSELLSDQIGGKLSETQLNQVRRIRASADHLLLLINDVLAVSRLDARMETVDVAPVDLAEIVRAAIAWVEPAANAKGLSIDFLKSSGPVIVASDERKLRQIALNLLSNAVKFTGDGRVSVALRPDGANVVLEVCDTGRGIAAQHLEEVFQPFFQVQQGHTRDNGGAGLGLSVSRELARLLGGDLTVESELGIGSRFVLRAPVRVAAAGHAARRLDEEGGQAGV